MSASHFLSLGCTLCVLGLVVLVSWRSASGLIFLALGAVIGLVAWVALLRPGKPPGKPRASSHG
jgi:hypothetical protein